MIQRRVTCKHYDPLCPAINLTYIGAQIVNSLRRRKAELGHP